MPALSCRRFGAETAQPSAMKTRADAAPFVATPLRRQPALSALFSSCRTMIEERRSTRRTQQDRNYRVFMIRVQSSTHR